MFLFGWCQWLEHTALALAIAESTWLRSYDNRCAPSGNGMARFRVGRGYCSHDTRPDREVAAHEA
jgi:hypothetical protein